MQACSGPESGEGGQRSGNVAGVDVTEERVEVIVKCVVVVSHGRGFESFGKREASVECESGALVTDSAFEEVLRSDVEHGAVVSGVVMAVREEVVGAVHSVDQQGTSDEVVIRVMRWGEMERKEVARMPG